MEREKVSKDEIKENEIREDEIKEFGQIIKLKDKFEIKRKVKVQLDSNEQLFVRIPKEIERILKIKKGDLIEFEVKRPHPERKQELVYGIKIIKDGRQNI